MMNKKKGDHDTEGDLQSLREENARLKRLLHCHGIDWQGTTSSSPSPTTRSQENNADNPSTPQEKIALFRRLFRGRTDLYPLRWESAKGKSGYSPACGNEWQPGICRKPQIKCADCEHRLLLPVTDQVIYDHLAGKVTIGVYPLFPDDTCCFLATDFDDTGWREDAQAFLRSCKEMEISASLEISRSGNGAHVWIFFDEPVPAREARQLGAALISHACNRDRQLSLTSYDRFFPNQDTMPKGGFGNLIALPLQKHPRELGRSVFVDAHLTPYPDQWAYLASIHALKKSDLELALLKACDGRHPLDVAYSTGDDEPDDKPWQRSPDVPAKIPSPLPKTLNLVLANQVFVRKDDLTQPLMNRLIRLAAFQNPEFYKAQAMRLSVWNKPRVIGCAENHPQHISLPRGCLEEILNLLRENEVASEIQDERLPGRKIKTKFRGKLRKDQKAAVTEMLAHEFGILCAPTAFGKTVTAAALIARRKVSTLILVHRKELQRQWQERLLEFLDLGEAPPGLIGGGKNTPTGLIDIAVMQSLSRHESLGDLLDNYGQIIVDECHHLSAFTFEKILKQAQARYVTGLTATPVRRDGHHPIIFMQCGPIRHTAAKPQSAPSRLEVRAKEMWAPAIPPEAPIQEVFRILCNDAKRNRTIVRDIQDACTEGRKVLVITERTSHLQLLHDLLPDELPHCYVLHGRMPQKRRAETLNELQSLDDSQPRVLLATGRLIGEGFDHPPLDTLILAMPISWKGTLQQYAGRLHREHAHKHDVRVYDYAETNHPQLARMWAKRQAGYHAMGYKIRPSPAGASQESAVDLK